MAEIKPAKKHTYIDEPTIVPRFLPNTTTPRREQPIEPERESTPVESPERELVPLRRKEG